MIIALKVTSDYALDHKQIKELLKCASVVFGVQFVAILGILGMHKLFADNLDILHLVINISNSVCIVIYSYLTSFRSCSKILILLRAS